MKTRNLLPIFILLCVTWINAAEVISIDLMWSNDMHGGIDRYEATFMNPEFPPMLGGGAVAATYIDRVRSLSDAKNRANLLVDVGDFYQGHPVGTVSRGKAVIEYMNRVGYDLTVIGNHEYDHGEESLLQAYALADFPVLSCNVLREETGQIVEYAKPYIILERAGLRLGIVGLTTTDTELMSFPDHIKGLEFRSEKEALLEWVPKVREQGVDLVIVVGHLGLPYNPEPAYQRRYESDREQKERVWGYDAQELAHEVPGIDVLVGGHMHKGFREPWFDPMTHTMVVQGYAYGSNIGHIILEVDPETRTLAGYRYPAKDGILVTLFEDEFHPDEEVGPFIEAETAEAEKGMDEVIGTAAVHLVRSGGAQSRIGNLICEAMLERSGANFSFLNLGGVRGEIAKGPITYRDVFNVMPFDNQLVLARVSGAFLKRIIEKRVENDRHGLIVAGVKVVFSKERPNFDRVTSLTIGGEPWDPEKEYTIATTDFLLQGNAGLTLLTTIEEDRITRFENSMRDEIVEYIRQNTPVSTELDDRWVRDDSAEPTPAMREALKKLEQMESSRR